MTTINSKNWKQEANELIKGTRSATSNERFSLNAPGVEVLYTNKNQTSGIWRKGNVIAVARDLSVKYYTKIENKPVAKPVFAPAKTESKIPFETMVAVDKSLAEFRAAHKDLFYSTPVETKKAQTKTQTRTRRPYRPQPETGTAAYLGWTQDQEDGITPIR